MTGSQFPHSGFAPNGFGMDQMAMMHQWSAQQHYPYPYQQHYGAHPSALREPSMAAPPQGAGAFPSMADLAKSTGAASMADMAKGSYGGSVGAVPSMSDLAKDSSAGGSGNTVTDVDVKVLDGSGRNVPSPSRYATFEEVPFPATIKADLLKAGFPSPSQIQQYTWPLALQQRDTIGVAATGSGKTLAFLLPAFSYILERGLGARDPTLLVIAPTRELAVQIEEESRKFGRSSGIRTTCCYGGAPKHDQLSDIRAGVHGIVGTPGRLNDFLEANQLRLDCVAKLVLDEADRMLDMGFEPQIRKILAKVPRQRHTLFFTATWPPAIRRLASEFLRDAFQVQIGNRDELKGNQDIIQVVKPCTNYNKNQILMQVLQQAGVADKANLSAKAIVFCGTKRMCDQVSGDLRRNAVPCAPIHGDKNQREREQALGDLKVGQIKLLVATDVAARGLDIKGITLVVNYDLPAKTEDYVHRIGRTGRAGQKGYAVALVSERDAHALRGIIEVMKRTNQEIPPDVERMAKNAGPPPPSGRALRMGGPGRDGPGGGGGCGFGGRDRSRDRRRSGRSRSRSCRR